MGSRVETTHPSMEPRSSNKDLATVYEDWDGRRDVRRPSEGVSPSTVRHTGDHSLLVGSTLLGPRTMTDGLRRGDRRTTKSRSLYTPGTPHTPPHQNRHIHLGHRTADTGGVDGDQDPCPRPSAATSTPIYAKNK